MNYSDLGDGLVPILQVGLQALNAATEPVEVDAYLDSGAFASLFDGSYLLGIGLNLLGGRRRVYSTTGGHHIEARVHRIRLFHEELGNFELEVGFSMGDIRRNLLGRDFFNLIHLGFRERHSKFFITATP